MTEDISEGCSTNGRGRSNAAFDRSPAAPATAKESTIGRNIFCRSFGPREPRERVRRKEVNEDAGGHPVSGHGERGVHEEGDLPQGLVGDLNGLVEAALKPQEEREGPEERARGKDEPGPSGRERQAFGRRFVHTLISRSGPPSGRAYSAF